MKRMKRALLMLGIASLLVCITVGVTVAYLTAQDSVTNTFTVGKVEISLDETKVDSYGVPVSPEERSIANSYKLVPGRDYKKDPTIHVAAGSEKCYLFAKVENGIASIEASPTIATQMASEGWTEIDAANHIYAYNAIIEAGTTGANIKVFNRFTIANDAAVADYETAQIKITAYAVQSYTFASASAAWAASGF